MVADLLFIMARSEAKRYMDFKHVYADEGRDVILDRREGGGGGGGRGSRARAGPGRGGALGVWGGPGGAQGAGPKRAGPRLGRGGCERWGVWGALRGPKVRSPNEQRPGWAGALASVGG